MSDINVKIVSENHTHKGVKVVKGTVLAVDKATADFLVKTKAGELVKQEPPKEKPIKDEGKSFFGSKIEDKEKEN